MRHSAVVEMLGAPLPPRLPAPPAVLLPVRTDTGERRAPSRYDPATARRAAVLALIVPGDDGDARIVLTERVDRGGHHSGEVSFPGGSLEPEDADEVAAALREATEEIGLDPAAVDVRVAGTLEPFWIPVSDFHVTPVVAVAARRPDYRAQPAEVARILEAPLDAFVPGARIVIVEREVRGWRLRYGAYPIGDLLVWGATARILGQLGALVASDAGGDGRT
ncbi:MAG TPA: CoA pyrophosphatase [Candidatus Dormibacteraeota bacterium]|nr:CoA pyrophosphatase [Candidatus Dormibacteraeota bacterium]